MQMLPRLVLLVAGLALSVTFAAGQPTVNQSADQSGPGVPSHSEIEQLNHQMSVLSDGLSEVRRDQLNYQIEKDLLKETYASNLQTVNQVIAIIFGAVTVMVSVLGYLGLKSVSILKAEFGVELKEFRASRAKLESDVGQLIARASEVSTELSRLKSENSAQDAVLKRLESRERAKELYDQKQYREALKAYDDLLTHSPRDEFLLTYKAFCHVKLYEFAAAQKALRDCLLLLTDPASDLRRFTVENLAELLVLAGDPAECQAFLSEHKDAISVRPLFKRYLDIATAVRHDDIGSARNLLEQTVTELATDKKPILKWGFDEARYFASHWPGREGAKILVSFLELFEKQSMSTE